jgi:uncharacterized membrane protein YqjE
VSSASDHSTGLLDSASAFGSSLLATVQSRAELLSLELQEEKLRLTQMFIWASIATFAGTMAATFATLTVVYLCWESGRLAVLASFAVLYSAATVGLVVAFRRFLRRAGPPLAATRAELEADAQCIRRPN